MPLACSRVAGSHGAIKVACDGEQTVTSIVGAMQQVVDRPAGRQSLQRWCKACAGPAHSPRLGNAQEHRAPFSLGYPACTPYKVRIAPVPYQF